MRKLRSPIFNQHNIRSTDASAQYIEYDVKNIDIAYVSKYVDSTHLEKGLHRPDSWGEGLISLFYKGEKSNIQGIYVIEAPKKDIEAYLYADYKFENIEIQGGGNIYNDDKDSFFGAINIKEKIGGYNAKVTIGAIRGNKNSFVESGKHFADINKGMNYNPQNNIGVTVKKGAVMVRCFINDELSPAPTTYELNSYITIPNGVVKLVRKCELSGGEECSNRVMIVLKKKFSL